jgi:SAM-dependent methyltransferase
MTAPADAWNVLAADWHHERRQQLWRAHSDAVNVDLCRRWWPATPVTRLLKTDLFDEAVGRGLLPDLAAGAAVFGIDRSARTAGLARDGARPLTCCSADVRRLPFASGSFDLVLSVSTLDHFERAGDIGVALDELYRVLAPGGRLILTLDNGGNPVVALRNALPFRVLHGLGIVPYFVGSTCRPGQGAESLRRAGFEVGDMAAVMHCPRVAGVGLARATERWGGTGAARRFLAVARRFERLSRWPTRWLSGYFVAYLATKPGRARSG